MMYIVRESERSYGFDPFFIACVLFGAFFVLNLMIAVQFTYLGAAFDEEERRQKEIKDKMNLKKKLKMVQEQEDSFFDEDEDSNQDSQAENGDQDKERRNSEGNG
jgi:predicted membrane protein